MHASTPDKNYEVPHIELQLPHCKDTTASQKKKINLRTGEIGEIQATKEVIFNSSKQGYCQKDKSGSYNDIMSHFIWCLVSTKVNQWMLSAECPHFQPPQGSMICPIWTIPIQHITKGWQFVCPHGPRLYPLRNLICERYCFRRWVETEMMEQSISCYEQLLV